MYVHQPTQTHISTHMHLIERNGIPTAISNSTPAPQGSSQHFTVAHLLFLPTTVRNLKGMIVQAGQRFYNLVDVKLSLSGRNRKYNKRSENPSVGLQATLLCRTDLSKLQNLQGMLKSVLGEKSTFNGKHFCFCTPLSYSSIPSHGQSSPK